MKNLADLLSTAIASRLDTPEANDLGVSFRATPPEGTNDTQLMQLAA